ncbi:MAG: hypothetical protein AAFW70_28720, partial [Cyanobacteria bacterium J06635_10]
YQILEVSPAAEDKDKREEQKISTTVVTKKRGGNSINTGDNSTNTNDDPEYFYEYLLDQYTISKLEEYPRKGDDDKLSSYLPSSGVVFSEGFIETLSGSSSEKIKQTEVNNFYQPMRTLLYSRKISQLISKTWWSYLRAKETKVNEKSEMTLWDKFVNGDWECIIKFDSDSNYGLDILDGLIAREIFLYGGSEAPDNPDPEEDFYKPLKGYSSENEQARFLILPSSKGWRGICLSLLLAGQAYYKIKGTNKYKYHQISQPIFSTGEITMLHSIEVDWSKFHGDIKEIIIDQNKPWVGYHIVIPYPPIPSGIEKEQENLQRWAWAKEEYSEKDPQEERYFPFYIKGKHDEYLIDVEYFRPPYPYIPLSCS